MKFKLGFAAALCCALTFAAPARASEGGHDAIQPQKWSFAGAFGRYDPAQLQRGFKVFREVCANCHSANLFAFRTLAEPGGPLYTEEQTKEIAAQYKVKELSDKTGDLEERPARPSDYWPAPFANEIKAREANGGAVPPDLSVIAKARAYHRGFPRFILDGLPFTSYQEHGPDYIYSLLLAYKDNPPAGETLDGSQSWNEVMPGNKIGMPRPLADGAVDYPKDIPATEQQYARDVSAFLMWMAEPKLDQRKSVGVKAMLFLIVLAGLLYATKKAIWRNVQH